MMKNIGNIIMNGFTKVVESRHKKRIAAAAVAIVLTAAVVTTSVFNRAAQAAENADTLMGIEKLRNQFSDGAEYTVLEIVPDINAAEIGYLFDGYEPILSEWDSETMTWKSWKDILCGINNFDGRKTFIESKTAQLKDYYAKQGINDNFPVTYPTEAYEDSEDYKEGYEKVEAGSYEKTGYFTSARDNLGAYNVRFENAKQDGAVYYKATDDARITPSMAEWLADDTYVYKLDGSIYVCVGTWASVRDSIVYPTSNQEETGDENKDDKDDGTDKEGGNDTGDNTGDGDNRNEGGTEGDTGNGDGGNEGGGSGDGDNEGSTGNGDGGNEGGTGSGDGGNEGGTGSGDGGNNEGGTGNGDGGNNEGGTGNDDAAGTQSGTSAALNNSVSKVKWLKYIGSDVPSNDEVDTTPGSGSGSGHSSENGQSNGSGGGSNGSNDNNPDDQTGKPDNDSSGETGTTDGSGGGDDGSGNNADDASGDTGSDNGDGKDDTGSNTDDGNDDSGNNGGTGNGGSEGNNGDGKDDSDKNNGDGKDDSDKNNGDGKDDSNKNNGDDNSDNDQEGDGTDDDENKEDNTGDDSETKPGDEDKDSGKDLGKDPNKDSTAQDFTKAQSEPYYIVYFDRAEDGEYIVNEITPAKYSHDGDGPDHLTGQYNFKEEKEGDNIQTYTFPGRILYCKGVFHSNEWFKQYVINMNKENFDNFKVKVITLTPKMLNEIYEKGTEEYEQNTIPDFDFLYLNSGLRTSVIDIIGPSGEDTETKPAPEPDKNEDTDNTGDNGDGDKTGDDGNTDKTGDDGNTDKTGDDGNTDKTGEKGDADKTGDNGDTDKTGDNGDADKTGNDDKTGDKGDADKTGEADKTEDNSDVDKTGNDVSTGDDGNAGNSADGGSTDKSSEANNTEGNTGNSDSSKNSADAENKSSDSKTSNINNGSYSGKSSLWKAFVSTDDPVDASKSEVSSDTGKSNDADKSSTDNKSNDDSTGNTDSTGATGSTVNEDTTDVVGDTNNNDDTTAGSNNDNTTGNAGNNDDTTGNAGNNDDSTGDADNKDGNTDNTDNKDNTDDADGAGTGDAADPDKSEDGSGDGEAGKEDPSSDSDSKADNKSDTSIILYSTAEGGDLSKDVANLLFKTVSAKALPCLVDGSIIYGKSEEGGNIVESDANTENTALFRLAAMLCQETLEKDYTSLSKEDLLKGIVDDADKNYTTEQVYCRLGNGSDSIINGNFFNHTIYKEGGDVEEGFQNVLDEINLENLYRKSDTSGNYKPLSTNIAQAEAIRHILNYQNRRNVETKKSIKVLEIQPALTTEAEITKEQLKKWAPGVEEVETTIMTTAEFIGKIDKINEIYDLVYIGTSKEHLNLSNWVTDTGKSSDNKYLGSTVFNDKDMDGLIYYNVGDKRVVYLPMSGLLDSEYKNGRTYYYNFTRYGGNDITKEKKDALISFLNGSYPVIVSDEFIEQPVTVFEDDEYAGRRATLDVGEYKEKDLLDNQIFAASGTPAKGISSIQVKKGYQITLFDEPDFKGNSITLTEDVKTLTTSKVQNTGLTWNNRCRSAIVEKIEDAQTVRKIDGNHIDNSSYLYEFVNTAMEKKYTNFYAKGDIDENGSELFKFYLNRPKASLVGFTANGTKDNIATGGASVNDAYYIYPNTIGRYTLQYNFTIKNEGAASMDTRYYCKLYIDVNADGKFSEFEEVADIAMTNRNTGGYVSSNELYAGVPYTIIREVPTGYKGLLPWKVEVCQVNNENIYASQQGYTKLNGLDKEVLKICQINRPGDGVINLNEEINTSGRFFNILVYGGDYNGVHYPGITNDFELEVTTINIPEYEENYSNNNDYLSDFNMLILGFSDMYGDFTGDSESGAMGAIVDFINSGKSVLMAHDTTSFFNNPIVDGAELGYTNRNDPSSLKGYSNDWRFAATLNKYIRPLVGMDRYGVLTSSVVKRGVAMHEGNPGWNELMSSTKDVAYKPKSARKETVPEAQGYTYTTISAKDKRDDGNDANLDYTRNNLNLGNLDSFRNSYVSQRFDDCYYWDNGGNNYGKDNGEMEIANNGEVWQVHVTQVNQGQITEYPYKLQDDFEVGLTHAQYYQLDYTADDDGDGQSDLVVWYCLGGRTSGSGKDQTIYSQSPNDVRNNYYIYNKGNITYTGMGHASKNDRSWAVWYTFDEAKLFINTMIASYQAGVKPPTVTVLDSGSPDASQLTTMYRYYDNQHLISITDAANKDNYEKVYFTVRDLNFVKGTREIEVHAYYHPTKNDPVETITVSGEDIDVTRLEDLIYDPETDTLVDAYHLTSGEIYYILVPKDVISNCEKGLDIYFEAQSTVKTNTTIENVYTTDKVYAKLQVLRAYLFELD